MCLSVSVVTTVFIKKIFELCLQVQSQLQYFSVMVMQFHGKKGDQRNA